jgi:hypothetical protein
MLLTRLELIGDLLVYLTGRLIDTTGDSISSFRFGSDIFRSFY